MELQQLLLPTPAPLTSSHQQSALQLHYSSGAYYALKDTYTPWHTLPSVPAWPDWTNGSLLPEEAAFEMQMQHLRFPTPPITPPRGSAISISNVESSSSPLSSYSLSANSSPALTHNNYNNSTSTSTNTNTQTRTQSVIMKASAGQTVQSPTVPLNSLECNNKSSLAVVLTPLEAPISSSRSNSSESSASPSSDYICQWLDCGRLFETLESLAAHVTQLHAVPAPTDGLYYCRWSGCLRTERGFNARYKMLVHVRTHTKEKPHQCHLCEKSFSRAENLKIHIRSHSGEKPYVCTYEGCHKAYSNSSDRFKHTRTHSMEKPYMCKVPGCQKRYTDPSSLRKHVKTFKHTVQLLSSVTSRYVNSPPTHSNGSAQRSRSPLPAATVRQHDTELPMPTPINGDANAAYLCLPHDSAAGYYLNLGPEDVCHIKAGQLELECYYAAAATAAAAAAGNTSHSMSHNVTPYWYRHTESETHSVDADIDACSHTEMTLPLPLRKDDYVAMELDVDVDGETETEFQTNTITDIELDVVTNRGSTGVTFEHPLDLRVKRS